MLGGSASIPPVGQDTIHRLAREVVDSEELAVDAPLLESGMDSLSGVEFKNRLQGDFGGIRSHRCQRARCYRNGFVWNRRVARFLGSSTCCVSLYLTWYAHAMSHYMARMRMHRSIM